MKCPFCLADEVGVIETAHDKRNGIRRRRECRACGKRFTTYERAILSTPMLIKRDGRRERFDREKLLRGLRISCAKRRVSEADLETLVNEVEASLQAIGRPEVPSARIGDAVITRLKTLDQVAYIRYAIVYLRLEDLKAVRGEIDRLLDNI